MSTTCVIETQELTKRYGTFEAVRSLDLRVSGQRITGFLGRNGAGKSTTIKMLLGMTHPTTGSGTILGRSINDPKANREIRRELAYVGEDKQLYAYMTVGQLIHFTKSFYFDWQPEVERRLLKQYELPPNRKVKALSKGMRTKLALLLALSRRPALLILDEPSEGLDPVSTEELLQALIAAAADGTTVFFSSHQIAEVERIAEHVCIIDHGKLVMDLSLDDMRQDYRRITLGFTQEQPREKFRIQGIQQIQTSGRQVILLANRNADAIVELARSMEPVSMDVAPIGPARSVFGHRKRGSLMLWYKAWRESRARFLLSAVTMATLCIGFVLFHREGAGISDRPLTYVEYIWRIVYKGYLRELFVLLALLLGIGGLLRERDHGTAGFTLALPVSRLHLVLARAGIGLLEVVVLSLLPALIIPALSPLVGQFYPWSQALQFTLLWTAGGAFIFAIGFVASSIFAGEYTAPVAAFLSLLLYSVIVDLPFLDHYQLDIHDIMSGAGMPYFESNTSALSGPLPWPTLAAIILIVFSLVTLAGKIAAHQDF